MKSVPPFILPYLWDIKKPRSAQEAPEFIIERVLEFGDTPAVAWLDTAYSREEIIAVLKKSRKISPKTGAFFALYYGVPKKELECFRKPFTRRQDRF